MKQSHYVWLFITMQGSSMHLGEVNVTMTSLHWCKYIFVQVANSILGDKPMQLCKKESIHVGGRSWKIVYQNSWGGILLCYIKYMYSSYLVRMNRSRRLGGRLQPRTQSPVERTIITHCLLLCMHSTSLLHSLYINYIY